MAQETVKAYKLKITTSKALRLLKEYGIDVGDNATFQRNLLAAEMDIGKLQTICETCFDHDFSNVDFDELDLKPVALGVADFLLNALGGSKK